MSAIKYPIGLSFNRDNQSLNENVQKPAKLLGEFIVEYLSKCHRDKNYKLLYKNTLTHVLNFCEVNAIENLYTNSVDAEFCEDFVYYLQSKCNLMQNTVKGIMERLNAMLQKACNYGYPINNTYREITVSEEEVTTSYLNMTEITRIYYYDKLTRFQSEIRDLFIVGCLTGLRYSDYSRLTDNNFINDYSQIRIKTRKTGTVIQVPMHKFVKEILKKYNYKMPKARCLQYFNMAIKEICKQIGLNDNIPYERTVGTSIVRKTLEKWEVISSHTARRSFATNMFLSGIPAYRIMLITGHQSEKSFFKYIRITREENALSLSNHAFFQTN